jgi:hypothetical protein
MIAADGVAVWQFRQMTPSIQRLMDADEVSLAVTRVHFDIEAFSDSVAALASNRETGQFVTGAISLREKFLVDVEQAEQLIKISPAMGQDATISSTLQTLSVALPSQLDTEVGLATAGDWDAVQRRLAEQIKDLINLSSLLVKKVDEQVLQERNMAVESTERARRHFVLIVPTAGLLTLLAAAALGWYVTGTITVPLSELTTAAQELARGNFQHHVGVGGDDELSVLGNAFNYAACQLQQLYNDVRRSESELRDLIENVPAMVFIALPGPSNAFVSCGWREYTGLSAEDTAGSGWQSVTHPEDLERHMEKWRVCSETGEPYEDETRFRRAADGQYRWFLVRAVPLRDETGNILKWYGVLTDIEDRRQAEQALRRSETELRQLIDAIPQQVFVFDAAWNPLFANQRDREYTGLAPEEAQLKDAVARIFHPEDLKKLEAIREQALLEAASFELEARIRGKDGQYRWFLIRDNPLRDEQGRVLRWYGTRTDIEDRKRAEEELRRAQAELARVTRVVTMGELAASIAHEINQPISAIVSNGSACLRWLAGDPPNLDEARENARRIVRDGKRAGDVIIRVRALATKTATAKVRLDMNEVIQEVIGLARGEVHRNGAVLRTEFAVDLSPVLGDRVELQQVVLNLVMNGVEAMSTVGDRPQELLIRTQNDEGDQVRVTVQDSGIGLDPQNMERIFDAFYTTKHGGMGMGLSISRSIVQHHGGRLWAVANDGPGTTFHFTVPKYQ